MGGKVKLLFMNQNFSNESPVQNILPSTPESEYILPAPQTSMPDHQLQAPANDAPREHKKRRSLLALIVAALVLLFLGGAGYVLAKQGYIEMPLPFLEKEPEEVLQKSMQNIMGIQSTHFISHIDASAGLKNLGGLAYPEMFGIESGTDEVPEKSPENFQGGDGGKTALSLSLLTEGDWRLIEKEGGQQSRFKGMLKWEGLTMEFDVETKKIGDILYFKIYQMPPIPLLSLFTGGIDLKEQWFKVDVIEDIPGETKQKAVALLDVFADALVLEKLKGERLDGVKTYHYGVSFDAKKLKGALTETRALLPELLSFTEIEKSEAQKMEEKWSAFLEQDYQRIVVPHLQALRTEVWIGKKDYFVRKITMQYALPQAPESTGAAKDEMDAYDIFDTFTLAFDYQFSAINAGVVIDPPENSRDFMEELQNGPFEEARMMPRDAEGAADISTATDAQDKDSDNLPDELEALFGTDPLNPDTDGDGYMDGVEIENEYNPLGEGKLDIDWSNAR